jgi:hypothetical protein
MWRVKPWLRTWTPIAVLFDNTPVSVSVEKNREHRNRERELVAVK